VEGAGKSHFGLFSSTFLFFGYHRETHHGQDGLTGFALHYLNGESA
jgi:hypothetical protein